MSNTSNALRVTGSASSTLELGSGWTMGGDTVIGGVSYHTYSQDSVSLQIAGNIGTVKLASSGAFESPGLEALMAQSIQLDPNNASFGDDGFNGNLLATGYKSPSSYNYTNNLLFSTKATGTAFRWGNTTGATTISYQIETGAPKFGAPYNGLDALKSSFVPFNSEQQAAAKAVVAAWENVLGVDFIANTVAGKTGDLRWFGSKSIAQVPTAHAFSPDGAALAAGAGDVWVGPKPELLKGITPGSYGYLTFLHELGHALGLIHPHDSAYTPEPGTDTLKYTVMSYRDFAGDDLGGYNSGYYPTTPMLNDIAALQYLYGSNGTFHADNDTYYWAPEKSVYETIWDTGGIDTIDAGNQLMGVVINLNEAQWSQIGKPFNNGQESVRDCLTIARGVILENAKGSAQDDTLIGNAAANTLTGNLGDDNLQGGAGQDTAVYSGNFNQYRITLVNPATLELTVQDNNPGNGDDGTDTLTGLEQLKFADKTIAVSSLIPRLSVGSLTVKEGQSGQSIANIPVTLSAASSQTVTVKFTTQDDSATAGSDYVAQQGTLTFAPGDMQKNIQVLVNGDRVLEGDETVKITLSNPQFAQLGNASGVLTLQNDEIPTLTLSPTVSVDENNADGKAVIDVQLSIASATPVTVAYTTVDGTAKAGSDYTTASGTLTIPAGATSATLSVPLMNDSGVETDETFGLQLGSTSDNAQLGTPATATVTIHSEDAYAFTVGGNLSFAEGNEDNNAVVTVKLSQAAADYLSVNYETKAINATAGIDYKESSGTLSFAPGETEQTVLIPLLGDTQIEANEAFQFVLSGPASLNTTLNVGLGIPSSAVVTIQNDDYPTLSFKDISGTEGNSGSVNAVFTLALDQAATTPLTVDYATQDGTATAGGDYTTTKGTVTFAAGQIKQTVSIPILADTTAEANETFSLLLSNPGKGLNLTQTSATATIVDDDIAQSLTIAGDKTTLKASETATLTFTFLSAPKDFTATDVSVTGGKLGALTADAAGKIYTAGFTPNIDNTWTGSVSVAGEAYTDAFGNKGVSSNTLTLTGDTQVPTLFSSSPADNAAAVAADSSIVLAFSESVQAGAGNIVISNGNGDTRTISISDATQVNVSGSTVTINPNTNLASGTYSVQMASGVIKDTAGNAYAGISDATTLNFAVLASLPTVSIANTTVTEGNSGSSNATLTVSLSAAATQSVTVNYATADGTATAGSDYVPISNTLTFAPGETSKTLSVPVIGDTAVESDETLQVNLSSPSNATLNGSASSAIVTISNDDVAVIPVLSIADATVLEGGSGSSNATLTVSLSAAATQSVTVSYATADSTATAGSDYVTTSNTLTFAPGETSKTLSVPILGDILVESDETFRVNLSAPSNATLDNAAASATVTIGNDDVAADTTPPTLVSSSPADNATAVAVGSNIVLTFSEAVQAGAGSIYISNTNSNGTDFRAIPITDGQVSISGNTVTINPGADLVASSAYNVIVDSAAINSTLSDFATTQKHSGVV
ncbi:MAG: hypothetical protein EPN21_03345 [Methylococcaceae bacterium]|nr:MAG: hypothetical protein EPN21_03345 [Methylococcaceae bacterium]